MAYSITLPGGATGTNGPVLGVNSSSFYTDQYNVGFPNSAAGVRKNLDGNYIVKINSISPDRLTGNPDTAIWYSPAGANFRAGETITSATDPQTLVQLRIFYNGTQPTWYRNNDGLGRCTDNNISTGAVVYTYPGSIAGTWSWYTVPSAPPTISTSVNGTSVTVTRSNSASDGGSTITDYRVQRRESSNGTTWGTWTTAVSMATTYTFSGLTPAKYYQFRIYAVNAAGNSTATTSPTVFIAAITKYNGTQFALLSKLKKHTGTSWTNITTANRYNRSSWEKNKIYNYPKK